VSDPARLVLAHTERGTPIFYHLTRDRGQADCPDCRADVCVQQVQECDDWEMDLIVHGHQREIA